MGKDIRICAGHGKGKGKNSKQSPQMRAFNNRICQAKSVGVRAERHSAPDALFVCLEKLDELADKASSPELDEGIYTVLKQITAAFLLPGKG